jgi:acetylornithine/succinyldiaminopimelate/putrescine aminotransferase
MIGIECTSGERSIAASARLLEQGFVLLPSGEDGRVLSLTPPLTIGEQALADACDAIARTLASCVAKTDSR